MLVAVTGATGIVGRFVVERLAREGARIRALVRPTSDRRE
ncbi:MAG: NmrA family NAD(P)-binding protein, partial [Gammaproteobacteria bacterium]|nr:NmrA family NAD(P)-binding protein [Gammaproteobacteria bacterium]